MPTITVTAYGNVVVISISSVMRMFGSLGETPIVDWDVEVAQQQWQEDCTAWNFQMDDWEATRQAVADAAEEAANELEALADEIEAGIIQSGLETAEASCKEVAGKPMCFDFFIMNCALGPIQGDCRDFDKNADFSS